MGKHSGGHGAGAGGGVGRHRGQQQDVVADLGAAIAELPKYESHVCSAVLTLGGKKECYACGRPM
jgi:hypothetical protein